MVISNCKNRLHPNCVLRGLFSFEKFVLYLCTFRFYIYRREGKVFSFFVAWSYLFSRYTLRVEHFRNRHRTLASPLNHPCSLLLYPLCPLSKVYFRFYHYSMKKAFSLGPFLTFFSKNLLRSTFTALFSFR